MKNVFPTHLSDHALVAEVIRLSRSERGTMIQLVVHLAEMERRRLFRPAGYSSLFVYCMKVLKLSEEEAYNRMVTARAVRRFPEILDYLADGSLNLTTVRLIGKRLTPENHQELIHGARRKNKREVQELIARLFPQPDVPATVRALPNPHRQSQPPLPRPPAPPVDPVPMQATATSLVPSPASAPTPAVQTPAARPVPPPPRPAVLPLAPERYQVTFTASADTREKLEFARDLLRRIRDRGRCTFVGRNGLRCDERAFVEFEHIIPRAKGGKATMENTCLLCSSQNAYTAELQFGRWTSEDIVREPSPAYGRRIVNNTRSGTGVVNKHYTAVFSG